VVKLLLAKIWTQPLVSSNYLQNYLRRVVVDGMETVAWNSGTMEAASEPLLRPEYGMLDQSDKAAIDPSAPATGGMVCAGCRHRVDPGGGGCIAG
jgi:hypothetical protein